MEEEKCKECKYYYHQENHFFVRDNEGLCRRYPEGLYKKDVEWCGEYRQKVQVMIKRIDKSDKPIF